MSGDEFQLSCHSVSFVTPLKRQIIRELSLSIEVSDKACLIGRNGVGKTTLARLLAGDLQPSAGEIVVRGRLGFVPQRMDLRERAMTVSTFLGLTEILAARARADAGQMREEDAAILAGAWTAEEEMRSQLARLGLGHISLERPLRDVSGGELRRLHLARCSSSDFLILDEPTNDLDMESRRLLRKWLAGRRNGWLAITHDRDLLELAESVAELTEGGLRVHSGSYASFLEAREAQERLLADTIVNMEKSLRKQEKTLEVTTRRQQRRTQKAADELKDRGINRSLIQILKERAQRTATRVREIHDSRIEDQRLALADARSRVRRENRISVPLPQTRVDFGEPLIRLAGVTVSWGDGARGEEERVILRNFNFSVQGPERVALLGPNGSGKTTLLRLMAGTFAPRAGDVWCGEKNVAYLDQQTDGLDDGKSTLRIVQDNLGTQLEEEARAVVEAHRFPVSLAERPVGTLSGGERLRAALLVMLARRDAPRLLLLDEPTNNLDLPAVECLEAALCAYEGAIVVVSHEMAFLKNIGVTKFVKLSG